MCRFHNAEMCSVLGQGPHFEGLASSFSLGEVYSYVYDHWQTKPLSLFYLSVSSSTTLLIMPIAWEGV